MITREQLELAAKAYSDATGIRVASDGHLFVTWNEHGALRGWKPITDHGQLLDLAMACEIGIGPKTGFIIYSVGEEVRERKVNCQDFPALAEAVITAAAEQQQAKETKE